MTKRTQIKLLALFFGLLSIFFSNFLSAAPQAVLSAVQLAAEKYVASQIQPPERGRLEIKANPLDTRLRLSSCPRPLTTTIPGKQSLSSNVTVLVACDTDDWQVYVPVRIKILQPLVVASRQLARGTALSQGDLTIKLVESRLQRGMVFERPAQIIGSKVKRTIKTGQAVQGKDICLVCRNDAVMIKASRNGLNIITKGKALRDGSLGEQIKVQNSKSRRIIDGTITDVGEVTVNF